MSEFCGLFWKGDWGSCGVEWCGVTWKGLSGRDANACMAVDTASEQISSNKIEFLYCDGVAVVSDCMAGAQPVSVFHHLSQVRLGGFSTRMKRVSVSEHSAVPPWLPPPLPRLCGRMHSPRLSSRVQTTQPAQTHSLSLFLHPRPSSRPHTIIFSLSPPFSSTSSSILIFFTSHALTARPPTPSSTQHPTPNSNTIIRTTSISPKDRRHHLWFCAANILLRSNTTMYLLSVGCNQTNSHVFAQFPNWISSPVHLPRPARRNRYSYSSQGRRHCVRLRESCPCACNVRNHRAM